MLALNAIGPLITFILKPLAAPFGPSLAINSRHTSLRNRVFFKKKEKKKRKKGKEKTRLEKKYELKQQTTNVY